MIVRSHLILSLPLTGPAHCRFIRVHTEGQPAAATVERLCVQVHLLLPPLLLPARPLVQQKQHNANMCASRSPAVWCWFLFGREPPPRRPAVVADMGSSCARRRLRIQPSIHPASQPNLSRATITLCTGLDNVRSNHQQTAGSLLIPPKQ